MGVRCRELLLLAACVCALAASESINKTTKTILSDDYEDFDSAEDVQEVLFNEDRPSPRDCICTVSQGYRIAKCNRLEVGAQKFGEDITDLVIEHADPTNPIQLDDFIFKKLGLHQIASVKIINSTVSYVGPNAFNGLHDLCAVNLSKNKLKSLYPETFATNKKLLLLTLSNNPSLKFPAAGSEEYFLNASSVQELDVSYCNMQYITANTFKNMPGLMYLNVAGNELSHMDPNTFKKLFNLEELDLSDNSIKSLPNDIFSDTELATLHIQKNPVDTVYGLQISDLLTLNAAQTNIKFFGPSMFNGMTYIANLTLSGNSIEKIHNQAFHKLVELNYLDLSFNDLDFISSILIKENIELDIFKISNNPRLKHLPADGFECSADQFNINLFDASHCGLEEIFDNSLKTFSALSVINLSDNKIKTIGNKVFSISPKLVEVNLAYNLLTTLDAKVFENNNELGKLNLQGNPLTVLSADVFIHTPLMSWLDMSHAELTYLWKSGKNHTETLLSNLTFLNVSHNRINEIKQSELDKLNKLRTLDISNNPLACSRDFENLMTWLSTRKVSPNAVSDNVANMAKDAKDDDETYSWEFLTRKTCGSALPQAVEPLPDTVSVDKIWERIDKHAEGNFDLKNTLYDGKVADDKADKLNEYMIDADKDDIGDDDDLTDEDEEDDEEDISALPQAVEPLPDTVSVDKIWERIDKYAEGNFDLKNTLYDGKVADDKADKLNEYMIDDDKDDIGDDDDLTDEDDEDDEEDDEDDDDAEEVTDDDDDDVQIKVKLNEKILPLPVNPVEKEPVESERVKLNFKVIDKDVDDLETEEYATMYSFTEEKEDGRYEYLWPIGIAIIGALLLLLITGKIVMMMCSKRNQQIRYNSAIIAAMQAGRTKKDCGLVYQQVSEELTGPKTPKLSHYQPLQKRDGECHQPVV